MTTNILQTNLFSGEEYLTEDGSRVFYQGFIPKDGHIVKYFPKAQHEFVLPHGTKFYKHQYTPDNKPANEA